MQDFRKLKIWQKSHQLTKQVYQVTSIFPKQEMYGITSQIRRACVSIPTNIAEGCGRESSPDFARFLQISFGSASELEYLFELAIDLKYISNASGKEIISIIIEVKKMLAALIIKVRTKN